MSGVTALIIAVVLLLANAFFVAAEFALIAARRSAVETRAEQGSRSARATLRAMGSVSVLMAGAQLGITLCSLGLGALAEPALAHLLEPVFATIGIPGAFAQPIAFVIALAIVVFAHIVYGEMVPKNLALAAPERTAMLLAPPMTAIVTVLKPALLVLNATANGLLRLMRVTPRSEVASSFTRAEVAALVDQAHREGLLDEDERDLVAGALALQDTAVARVVIPMDQLVTVPADAGLEETERIAVQSGYSRLPVSDGGVLVGYVHLKDIIDADRLSATARSMARPLAVIAVDEDLGDAISTMRTTGAHLALVEEGDRPVGVVMLEDVLAELVGEIRKGA